jgi:hypothetical protein
MCLFTAKSTVQRFSCGRKECRQWSMFTALSSSQFSFEGTVEDGGEQDIQLGGRLGLQTLQRIHFRHSFQSLNVASAMTSAAWRSHFDFRCGKSRRTAITGRRVPKWTLASSRPIARSNFSSPWPRGNCHNSIRLQ